VEGNQKDKISPQKEGDNSSSLLKSFFFLQGLVHKELT